jgi:hypothetical protein
MTIRALLYPTLLALGVAAQAGETTVSLGSDLSVFDNPRSQQGSAPMDMSYTTGAWTFEGTDAYIYREGTPATVFRTKKNKPEFILVPEHVGNRIIWVPRPRKPIPGEPTQYGWGDLSLNTTYSALAASEKQIGIDITASATLPTGSQSKNFSTGTEEYALGTVITKLAGPMTYSLNALHNWNGQIKNSKTEDNWSGQISGVYSSLGGNTAGLQFSWSQAAAPNTGSSRVASFISSIALSKRDKVAFTVGHGFGLSDPTTDINVTMSRTY